MTDITTPRPSPAMTAERLEEIRKRVPLVFRDGRHYVPLFIPSAGHHQTDERAGLLALTARVAELERERDVAQECHSHALTLAKKEMARALAAEARVTALERERDEARAKALEDAIAICGSLTSSDATPTLRPGARMCVRKLTALKGTAG